MNEEKLLKLEHQLCFSIYALSRAIVNRYRVPLNELDITYPQYLVMMLLWEYEIQNINQLGKKLHLDTGTLTPLLKRLETKKLIHRSRSKTDERVVEITLTVAGKNLKTKAYEIPKELNEKLPLTENELTQLKGIIQKLLDSQ